MKRILALIFLLGLAVSIAGLAKSQAQDEETLPEASVYVTTQDFLSLRKGPGRGFDRLEVIAPEVTLPAYGRSSDTRWVQVMHNGRYGWLATQYLIWSGDIIRLPVDGINPAPFVRRAAAMAVTTRETPYYAIFITPEDQIGTIPQGTVLELTGRVGEQGFFRFQVRYNDQLVWVGSWDVRVTEGDYRRLLDLAYLYGYGRLVLQLEKNIAQAVSGWSRIRSVWQRLDRGEQLSCTPIPSNVRRLLADSDATIQRDFLAPIVALNSGIDTINGTISAFADACANTDSTLTRENVDAQLAALDDAERNLILAASLLEPLRRRNPVLGQQTTP